VFVVCLVEAYYAGMTCGKMITSSVTPIEIFFEFNFDLPSIEPNLHILHFSQIIVDERA
jgi:hypothetical protein